MEVIRSQGKTLVLTGDNESNINIFRDSSKEESTNNALLMNEKKVSREKLEILLK